MGEQRTSGNYSVDGSRRRATPCEPATPCRARTVCTKVALLPQVYCCQRDTCTRSRRRTPELACQNTLVPWIQVQSVLACRPTDHLERLLPWIHRLQLGGFALHYESRSHGSTTFWVRCEDDSASWRHSVPLVATKSSGVCRQSSRTSNSPLRRCGTAVWPGCVKNLFALILNRLYRLFVSNARHFIFKTCHVSTISLVVSNARNFSSDQKKCKMFHVTVSRAGHREQNDVKTGTPTKKGVLNWVYKSEVFAIM